MKVKCDCERQVTKLDQKKYLEIFVKCSLNQPCHNDCGPQKENKPYHIVTPAEKMIFEANKVVIEKQSMQFIANESCDRKTISAPNKSSLPSLPHDTRDNAGRGGKRDNNESELR